MIALKKFSSNGGSRSTTRHVSSKPSTSVADHSSDSAAANDDENVAVLGAPAGSSFSCATGSRGQWSSLAVGCARCRRRRRGGEGGVRCEDRGDGWVLDDVVERELVGGLREAPDELEHLAAVPYPRPLWPTLTTARCLATPSIVGRTGGARAGSPTAVAMA